MRTSKTIQKTTNFALLILFTATAKSQFLNIVSLNNQATSYPIESVRKITIDPQNLLVHLSNNQTFFYPLEDLINYNYSSSPINSSIQELSKEIETKIEVFPNPFTEQIFLKFSVEKISEVSIKLLKINGGSVFESSIEKKNKGIIEYRIPVENLKSGIYIIQIIIDKKLNKIEKLIKL